MARHSPEIRLRPVIEADLDMFRRFAVEPGLIGLDWPGFRDPRLSIADSTPTAISARTTAG